MRPNDIESVYTDLEQILDVILRNHLKFQIKTPGRAIFDNIKNWEIRGKEPGPNATEQAVHEFYMYKNPEYRKELYYGTCDFLQVLQDGTEGATQVRVICESLDWLAAAQILWTVKVWVKTSGNEVTRHCFTKLSYHGQKDDNTDERDIPEDMKLLPPLRIAFVEHEETTA